MSGIHLSTEVTVVLARGPVLVKLLDHYITDGELIDGDLSPDELEFNYRVFDIEEDAEILQLSHEDREIIWKALVVELQSICGGEDGI
jgi:hypothetical protein